MKVGVEEKSNKFFWATVLRQTEDGLMVKFDAGPLRNSMLIDEPNRITQPRISESIANNPGDRELYGKPSAFKMLFCLKPGVLSIYRDPVYQPDWSVIGGWAVLITIIVLIMVAG